MEHLTLGTTEADAAGLPAVVHASRPWTPPFLPPDIIRQPSEEEIIKLAPPPKKA